MKNILGISAMLLASAFALWSCEESEDATPVVNTTASGLTANFTFINAVPGLQTSDLLVNNVKAGASASLGDVSRLAYTSVAITTNNLGANTNVRAKAVNPATIGGVLGSGDIVFRAANTNANNLQANVGARYTFIAVDSITRPRPVRTLNAGNFGDTTFFNRVTGQQVSTVQRAALTTVEKQRLVPLGTIPLGITDPGGPRFVALTDALTTSPAFPTPNQTQAGIRFINAVPNATNPNARGVTIASNLVTGLTARLVPPAPPNVQIGSANVNYVMAYQGFNPSVGSRPTTIAFNSVAIATAGVPIVYTLEIVRHLGGSGTADTSGSAVIASLPGVMFETGRYYTIVASGIIGGSGNAAPIINIIRHDNP